MSTSHSGPAGSSGGSRAAEDLSTTGDYSTAQDFDAAWELASASGTEDLRTWYAGLKTGVPLDDGDLVYLRATVQVCRLSGADGVPPVCVDVLDVEVGEPGGPVALRRVDGARRRHAWIEAMNTQCRHGYIRTVCAKRQPCR
ncbi:hypothetical protein [Cryptosporangium sp. NPDC051539]|uniref:hypothetical protein n=1 Tax=Cryptosporangium sp. NPDC051539 TaxID=3363962 RepID=UPI00379FC14B